MYRGYPYRKRAGKCMLRIHHALMNNERKLPGLTKSTEIYSQEKQNNLDEKKLQKNCFSLSSSHIDIANYVYNGAPRSEKTA